MSEFSWKSIRVAEHIVKSSGLSFQGMERTIEQVARTYDSQISAELEAQHRKTWALAIDKHASAARLAMVIDPQANELTCSICAAAVRATPCPPIEATKDK